GTHIRKNNIFSEKIPLEAFVLYEEPASFYQTGVWSEALRFLFEKTNINNDSQKEESLEKITQYLHSQHGVRYDIYSGTPSFTVFNSFYLMNYLKKEAPLQEKAVSNTPDKFNRVEKKIVKASIQNFNIVNCNDQGAAVSVLSGALGIKTEVLKINDFGYINETKLVGIDNSFDFISTSPPDVCNNPFFANIYRSPLRIFNFKLKKINGRDYIVDNDNLVRSGFGYHIVCAFLSNNKTFSDYANNRNQYEKDVLIYDACAGPTLGLDLDQYTKEAIDYNHKPDPKQRLVENISKVI
ncbi:hypothetical protein DKK76_11500, partial [Frischella perrara]